MTVEQLLIYGRKILGDRKPEILLAYVLKCDVSELFSLLDKQVDKYTINKYEECLEKAKNNYPIQYITNNVVFYGYNFYVDKNVLIPRFDTEQLVYYLSKYIKEKCYKNAKVLDIGCGSGAISITLSKLFPQLDVTGLDISENALKITKKNAKKNNVEINTIKSNLFEKVNEKFDIIVSNPPYISENDQIDDDVKNNEPSLALFGGKDGLQYYRDILKDIKNYINKEFIIAFEIGSSQKEDVIKIIKNNLENVKIDTYKDLGNRDRVVIVYND